MGKSYRLPYSTFTGCGSAKWDKRFANRAVRRKQNEFIKTCFDWDEEPFPHRYECSHNDVWGWKRDGKQRLRFIDHNDLNPFHIKPSWQSEESALDQHEDNLDWKMKWIVDLTRK